MTSTADSDPISIDGLLERLASERAYARSVRRTLGANHHEQLAAALERVRGGLGGRADVGGWALRYRCLLQELRDAAAQDADVRRLIRAELREHLEALREPASVRGLVEDAALAARDVCGFTRVLISAVSGSRWMPLVVHTRPEVDPDPSSLQTFVDQCAEIPLANLLAETEMVRRRAAVLVAGDSLERRTFKPIVAAARTHGYVGAPIVLRSETIGIIHGDRVGQRAPTTEDDRVVIGEFARTFAAIFERAWSEELLGYRADRIAAEIERTRSALELTNRAAGELPTGSARVAEPASVRREPSLDLLSPREQEVLDLVSRGATNALVAQRLTVSEETVKSHMRTILRKLHVSSRNAAVAKYRMLYERPEGQR